MDLTESIRYYINKIAPYFFTAIGLTGNMMIAYIFTRKSFRKLPMFRYLLLNNIINMFNLFMIWPSSLPNVFKMNTSGLNCKLKQYISYVVYEYSPWLLVVCDVDRLMSVKYSTRFQFRLQSKYQAFIVILILIILMLIDIPFLFVYDIRDAGENSTVCGYGEANYKIGFYLDLMVLFIALIIPFIIMIVSSVIIAHHLITHKKKLEGNKKRKFNKELKFVKVIFAVSLFSLICNLPYSILVITYALSSISYFNSFLFIIVNDITFIDFSFKFFVYLFSNKLFRKEFLSLVVFWKKRLSEEVNIYTH